MNARRIGESLDEYKERMHEDKKILNNYLKGYPDSKKPVNPSEQEKAQGLFIKGMRKTMKKAFELDPDFRRVYTDNIAMLLHDHHGITDIDKRNKAADDVIKLIFES